MSLPDIQEIKKQVDDSFSRYHELREDVVEDIRFAYVDGGQTNDPFYGSDGNERPEYVINRVLHPLNQINGRYRANKISCQVSGCTSDADSKVAEIFNGLGRKIESVSNADEIYSKSFNHIAAGGYSAWMVENDFVNETSFDQELKIVPIRDPFYNVWGDPASDTDDSRDWNYGFVFKHMSKIDFKRKYPDAEIVDADFVRGLHTTTNRFNWFSDTTVKVAEYYRVVFKPKTLLLLDDGTVLEENDQTKRILDELLEQGINVKQTRKVKKRVVQRYRVSGREVLEGPFTWPGRWIPIVECFGYNFFLDNVLHYRGKVKFAKDAQMLYNYAILRLVELHDPIVATKTQMAEDENLYLRFNELRPSVLPFTPDPQHQIPPQRMSSQAGGSPELQANLTLLQQADFAIKATMGDFGASLGIPETDQSGIAIRQLQAQADEGSFDLIDSLSRSIKYTWDLIVDAAPAIYDRERQVAVITDDGEDELVFINKQVVDRQTGEKVVLNDLSKGQYCVEVTVGPSTQTQKQFQLTLLNDARAKDQLLNSVSSDVFVKLLELPSSSELVKRIRKQLVSNGVAEPNEEEQEQIAETERQKQQDPMLQLQLQVAQLQMQKLMLENEEIAAKVDKLAIDHDKTRAEVGEVIAKTVSEYIKSGIPIRDSDLLIRTLQSRELINELTDQGAQQPENAVNSSQPPVPAAGQADVNQPELPLNVGQ